MGRGYCPLLCIAWGTFVVVYSKQHCLQTKKYDVAHVVIDMYIPTKFHGFISFSFLVMPYHSPIYIARYIPCPSL